jgi:dienelactone hydrolase
MSIDDKRLRHTAHWQDTFVMPTYTSVADWERRKAGIRRQVLFAAGLLPFPEKTPLNPLVTGTTHHDGFDVDNVAIESFPGFYCTGNLYRPHRPVDPQRVPVVLTPHGHWQEGRYVQTDRGSVPARCINFARQGYYAYAPDMVGYNDSRQVGGHRTFDSTALAEWGIGTLGLQLWNNIRALDYLLTLPGADSARVACTGESGGATQTYLLAAVDDRVAVSAPVNMLSAHYAGGCVCENAPGLRIDLTNMEIIASFAPKPQLIVAATGDWTVNTPRVEYPAVRSIYRLYDAEDALECVQFDAPHNYNLASREAVYGFLARHLGGRGTPTAPHPTTSFNALHSTPLAESAKSEIADVMPLRIFPDALPASALDGPSAVAAAAQRFFAAGSKHPDFRASYELALGAALPSSTDLVISRREKTEAPDRTVERFQLSTKDGSEHLPAVLIRPTATTGVLPVLLLHGDGKRAFLDGAHPRPGELAELLAAGRTVMTLDLFLTGDYLTPIGQTGRPVAETHFTGYNRTDDALRVQDVLTAVAALAHLTGAPRVDVIARGPAGLWASLARPLSGDLIADLRADDPQPFAAACYIPHLARLGGPQAAAAL